MVIRTPDQFNQAGAGKLPGYLGIQILEVSEREVVGELRVREELMAPNGFLHAGGIVTLADTVAGYGCIASLPPDATGFTTLELKSNHIATAKEGTLLATATPFHRGRS